jgi:hypothetical protein
MEIFSLLFLVAYTVLILWGLAFFLRRYVPSGRAQQFPRMARMLGISVNEIADSNLGLHLQTADHVCGVCEDKKACEEWLASHESAADAPAFCANAAYLHLAKS